MTQQTIIRCAQCGQVYTARVNDGEFVLPTEDGRCGCGARAFEEMTVEGEPDAPDGSDRVDDDGPPV